MRTGVRRHRGGGPRPRPWWHSEAPQAVLAQAAQITGSRATGPLRASSSASSNGKLSARSRFSRVSNERSSSFTFVLAEARERQIEVGHGLQFGQEVRAPRYPPEILLSVRLRRRASSAAHVEQDDRDRRQSQPTGGHEAAPTARDDAVPRDCRATTGCTKPNWRTAALENVELLVVIPRRGLAGSGWS